MKYLTKEWYLASQNTENHSLLTPSERAVVFSEEYFQELYRASEEKHLAFQRRVCDVDLKFLAAQLKDSPVISVDGSPLSKEEENKSRTIQSALAEALRTAPRYVFDSEKEKLVHRNRFTRRLEAIKHKYPPEILEKVADLRVLALEHAAPEVIDAIRQFCLQNKEMDDSASEAEWAEYQRNWSEHKPAFFKNFHFHDYRISSFYRDAKDSIMTFHTFKTTCRFQNATVLKCDGPLENARWLYDEIYPIASGYEIHALLLSNPGFQDCIDSYSDLIIRCSDVTISHQQ